MRPLDQIVIGGGIMGLATAVELARRGRRVTLIEARRIGGAGASSHGPSRVSRATYPDPIFAELMAVARAEDWPRLEAAAGQPLVHRSPGCFFGEAGGPIEDYLEGMRRSGVPVEILAAADARRRFPMMRFPGADRVIVDELAGAIAAADALATLRWLALRGGVEIREALPVQRVERGGPRIRVHTEGAGVLQAEGLTITAGPWTARLLPELEGHLRVVRQTVAHFAPPAGFGDAGIGAFPIWASLGREPDAIFYGLPALGRPGLKIARHEVVGRRDDPDPPSMDPASGPLARLRHELRRQLGAEPGALLHAETCPYTCTPTEDFVMDVHPNDSRIVVGAGFSGHGFKFAPLVGRILAGLAIEGRSDVAVFESRRARFRFPTTGGEA